jgi:hypothetical protein
METTSSESKSSWRSFRSSVSRKGKGFNSYFRKQQKREAELKEERLRREEEKLKQLLQPVRFSEEKEERIQDLKELKQQQRRQQQQARHRSAAQHKFFQRRMKALHHHTWEERVVVVTTLMVLLFVSLHADIVGPIVLPKQLFLPNSLAPWYIIVLKDWGNFCHMSACSLIHFALCDVSLIYAFEAMEVGTKTGPKVKEFYREKVHLAMAAFSGSIVALSICKALVAAWLRMLRELLETSVTLVGHGKDACANLVHQIGQASHIIVAVLARVGHAMLTPSEWIYSLLSGMARFVTAVSFWILAVLIPFDNDERPLAARMANLSQSDSWDEESLHLEGVVTILTSINNTLNTTLNESICAFANSHTAQAPDVTYWRDDAFETCRAILSRSAVFFVSLLVAMHYYTKDYRHKPNKAPIGAGGPIDAATFASDHSSIQTTPSLARDETEIHANLSSDTSMETSSTIAATRPASIIITLTPDD